jgi:hypothetical protein
VQYIAKVTVDKLRAAGYTPNEVVIAKKLK